MAIAERQNGARIVEGCDRRLCIARRIDRIFRMFTSPWGALGC
jgi:hypothetical protein